MEQEKTQEKKSNHADILKWVIIGLAIFIIAVLIFWAGMFMGTMKARFSYRWAEQYHRNFAGPKGGFFSDWRMPPFGDFIESHGVFGEIIKINDNDLVIKGRENIERIVVVNEKTAIKDGFKDIKISDLKVGQVIVVIGSPNDQGQIEAKLIRIFNNFPPLPPRFK